MSMYTPFLPRASPSLPYTYFFICTSSTRLCHCFSNTKGGAGGELHRRVGWRVIGGQRGCHGSWRGRQRDANSSTRNVSLATQLARVGRSTRFEPPRSLLGATGPTRSWHPSPSPCFSRSLVRVHTASTPHLIPGGTCSPSPSVAATNF